MSDVPWYALSEEELFEKLDTSTAGLSADEVLKRVERYGANALPEKKPPSLARIYFRQFNSPLIFILIIASALTYWSGDVTDSVVILAVLVFNATVGAIQEGRAQNTLSALKKFVETKAVVIRNNEELIITDTAVVPGDIISLHEGDKVPADVRLISAQSIKVNESSLTGESEPVHKITTALQGTFTNASEQKNMLFKGTHVVAGNGKAVVVATGPDTLIGKLAKEISTLDTEIPLKANIRSLSRVIIIATSCICVAIFGIGVAVGQPVQTMFATAVALCVAIIPEGLPVVITLVLATGVWRMSKRNALVKKLQAVEALGQARIIAVDKTGTITRNELVVRQIYVTGKMFDVGGMGYEPKGDFFLEGKKINPREFPEVVALARASALGSTASALFSEVDQQWHITGDPTEAAAVVFAEKLGFKKEELLRDFPRVEESPFDFKRKYHAIINKVSGKNSLIAIGAPEIILGYCTTIRDKDGVRPMTSEERGSLEKVLHAMSEQGQRMLAVGMRDDAPSSFANGAVAELTFAGFLGMKDVLRPEVKEAMTRAKEAGMRVVMITGDYEITARAIAREAGIFQDGDAVLSGKDIDTLSEAELAEKIGNVTVFARVTPEHKLEIIKAFRSRGEIIAMTGDGVNDALSLAAADLGVAMGRIGTEVAKEAADIILLDDNFGSIISAVEEGRNIYKTIKRVLVYLFSTSIAEVLIITCSLVAGLPLPLLAVQIIWLNFVTDGFLVASLAMEPKEDGLLLGTFERPKKYIVDWDGVRRMLLMALTMGAWTLFLFQAYADVDLEKAWTISLTTLAIFQWCNAWNCRSDSKSIFQMNPFSNKFIVGATAIIVSLQVVAIYTPVFQKFLHTVPLSQNDWLTIIPVGLSIILVEEIRKYFHRRKLMLSHK